MRTGIRFASIGAALFLVSLSLAPASPTVARVWNELNLDAIRVSFPDPPVHARNLFHVSEAMYDAWAAYDPVAVGVVHNEAAVAPGAVEDARHEAISYAAFRVLTYRYFTYPHPNTPAANSVANQLAFEAQMIAFGYPTANTDMTGSSPAAVGNRVAAAVLGFAATDYSRETIGYDDPTYSPVNDPLILAFPGTLMNDPNRWQPLAFEYRVTQNGIEAEATQTFVAAHWGPVRPFALHLAAGENLYHDPGPPPYLGGVGDAEFKTNNLELIRFSSWLDPDAAVMIDCSPGTIGNNTLGFNDGTGYTVNPITSLPYVPNVVNRADFGRVVAEFWADGPASETPPGHWNTLANDVVEDPVFDARIGGTGPILDPLEWDVKMYLPLNGSVHDVAVAVWGCKRYYDYVRPISSIRHLAVISQLPLETDLVEVITMTSSGSGEKHEHLAAYLGEIAVFAWGGEPLDPETEYTGAKWIRAVDWLPYQRDTFVTPAFAGYVSGHSGFSRAAAEVLTAMTGSPYFPGGMGSYTVPAGSLEFEAGPSTDVTLQWATYFDAADQAGISRLYGGIHVAPDDGPGRIIGAQCGKDAWALAQKYYDGTIATEDTPVWINRLANGDIDIDWYQTRGMFYKLRESPDLVSFGDLTGYGRAETDAGGVTIPAAALPGATGFYEVIRSTTGP